MDEHKAYDAAFEAAHYAAVEAFTEIYRGSPEGAQAVRDVAAHARPDMIKVAAEEVIEIAIVDEAEDLPRTLETDLLEDR